MSKGTHSPGPWEATMLTKGGHCCIMSPHGCVGHAEPHGGLPAESNGILMAASLDMLAALRETQAFLANIPYGQRLRAAALVNQVDATLEKATLTQERINARYR